MDETNVIKLLTDLGCERISARANGWVEATCPFTPWLHKKGTDKSPSFGVLVDAEGPSRFRCHSCNQGGSIKSLTWLLRKYRTVDRIEAHIAEANQVTVARVVREIAKIPSADEPVYVEAGCILVRRDILPKKYEVREPLPEPTRTPDPMPAVVRDYLLGERGFSQEWIDRWGIGWDGWRSRITIPVRDMNGGLRSVSGRAYTLPGRPPVTPKFLHTRGFQRDLFLYGEQTVQKGGVGYLAEGFFDVIAMQEWGYPAVAVLGTALSKVQLEKLQRFFSSIIVIYDGDKAGYEEGAKASETIAKYLPMRSIKLPEGLDPDDLKDPTLRRQVLGDPPGASVAA